MLLRKILRLNLPENISETYAHHWVAEEMVQRSTELFFHVYHHMGDTNAFYLKYSTIAATRADKIKNTTVIAFSEEEKTKILHALNEEPNSILLDLKIPLSYINTLENWRIKNGPFRSIDNVLNVEGMDIKNLAKMCQSILLDRPIQVNRKSNSKTRQLVTPVPSPQTINDLTSVVSLHVGPSGISWAKLTCPKRGLDVWNFRSFFDIPTKASSYDNFELAISVMNDIPAGDVYVFESLPGIGLQSTGQKGPVVAHIQQIEFNSMLLALLNTSEKHNKLISKDGLKKIGNAVYYVRAKLPARLFQTWVGTEKVSAIATVEKIFNHTEFALPCSPVPVNKEHQEMFRSQSPIYKELMSQSLLLSIAFLDLCIYKNKISLDSIAPSRN